MRRIAVSRSGERVCVSIGPAREPRDVGVGAIVLASGAVFSIAALRSWTMALTEA